jgi:hypothetical protein
MLLRIKSSPPDQSELARARGAGVFSASIFQRKSKQPQGGEKPKPVAAQIGSQAARQRSQAALSLTPPEQGVERRLAPPPSVVVPDDAGASLKSGLEFGPTPTKQVGFDRPNSANVMSIEFFWALARHD